MSVNGGSGMREPAEVNGVDKVDGVDLSTDPVRIYCVHSVYFHRQTTLHCA